MTKNNKSTNKVSVPNSIYNKLFKANTREVRTVLLIVQLLNEQACVELTNNPTITIKSSKFNKLTSNKSLQILEKVKEDFSDELVINIEGKTVTAQYKETPITYDFTKTVKNKLLILLFSPGTYTVVRFDDLQKLRKKNTINLYLTLSKYSSTNKVYSSNVNTLFEDCHLNTLGNSSKKTLILNAIDDLNTHVGRDVVSLNELANNVMISFNSSLFSVWQFDNKGKEANKPKTHREKDELIRTLKSENDMLNKTIEGNGKQKETTERLFQEELERLRAENEKLKTENEQLKEENEELRQANKDLAKAKGINTNLRDNRVDKLQEEIKELREMVDQNERDTFSNQVNVRTWLDAKPEINKKIDDMSKDLNSLIDDVNAMKVDKVTLEQFREVANTKIEDVNTLDKVKELPNEIDNLKGTIISIMERIEQLENSNQHQPKQEEKESNEFEPPKDNYDDFDVDDFNEY